jgi:hypothetical protein
MPEERRSEILDRKTVFSSARKSIPEGISPHTGRIMPDEVGSGDFIENRTTGPISGITARRN